MTHDEASNLARRIVNTFRLTAPVGEWIDAIADLRADVAAATFVRLRDETESGGLAIGKFLGRYREVVASTRRQLPDVRTCGTCGGSRYVEVRSVDERRHGPDCSSSKRADGLCRCHAVEDCPDCSTGHPRPPREDSPISFDEYVRRVKARRDFDELGRWERFLGHSLR